MDTKNDKTKMVATIDINIQWPKVTKQQWLEDSIDDHLNCVLCGGGLEFKHKTDFVAMTVSEDAHCPSCGVRNRQSAHILQ